MSGRLIDWKGIIGNILMAFLPTGADLIGLRCYPRFHIARSNILNIDINFLFI
jgi:hypothetical protein